MSERKKYRVTERAGNWVAGKKVRPGDVLLLTEAQAEYELMRGVLTVVSVDTASDIEAIAPAPRNMAIPVAPNKRRRR